MDSIEGEVCEWVVKYVDQNVNVTAIEDFLVESCENDSFPHFVCQFIADHIDELFNGEICKMIVGC